MSTWVLLIGVAMVGFSTIPMHNKEACTTAAKKLGPGMASEAVCINTKTGQTIVFRSHKKNNF